MKTDDKLLISSELNQIVKYCKVNGIKYSLSLIGAYSMISYAYMYGNNTLIDKVYRLKEGTILEFGLWGIKLNSYYNISFTEKEINEVEAIEKLDTLFTQAVKRQIDKNQEYGYMNVAPLSAGLDCRMTTFVLNKLCSSSVLNFTYSETGQLDHKIPAKIASYLKNEWLYKQGNAIEKIQVLSLIGSIKLLF